MLNSTYKVDDLLEFKPFLLNQKRIMGLDLGKKRIGISISTLSLSGALPLKTISNDKFIELIDALKNIVTEYDIKAIIFGLPKNMDGSEGKSTQSVRDKAEKICSELCIKYAFWDERLSTVAVERKYTINEKSRTKKRDNKKDIDNLAAAFILEGAINYIMKNKY